MRRAYYSFVAKWSTGFALSVFAIWGITAVFTENYYPRIWSSELQRNISAPGWVFDHRSEVNARTHFGALGLPGTANIHESKTPKLVIWGDSFVEAFHVADDQKMHRVLSSMTEKDDKQPLEAVAVGRQFQSFADYIFQIPDYERALDDIRLHVIHLHTLDDLYPNRRPEDRLSLFLTEPNLHFERYHNEYGEVDVPESQNKTKEFVFRARLQFFLKLKKQVSEIALLRGLRFSLGTQNQKALDSAHPKNWSDYLNPAWVRQDTPLDAWEFALSTLKGVTHLPVLIVYAPPTPTLHLGKFATKNAEARLAKSLEELCEKHDIGFVSLEASFLRHLRETGTFPRGFHTSRPWEGHYNPQGHRLAAEAIYGWIRQNPDVIHTD